MWHGAEVLLPALVELRTTHPQYGLRVIGNGERAALEQRARELGIGDAVEFLEAVPPAQLSPHLAGAVATLATLKPGTGYDYAFTSKAYSSLAAGCPVIFAGPGPTAAFLDDANRHVRAGAAVAYDSAAIAEAMRAFADSPLHDTRARGAGCVDGCGALDGRSGTPRRSGGGGRRGDCGRCAGSAAVNRLVAGPIDWMVRHRSSMPAWVDRLMESVARHPDGVAGRIVSRLLGGGGPGPVTAVPDAPVRVYIAPTNYSGQGYQWARALERADPMSRRATWPCRSPADSSSTPTPPCRSRW